jgi:hypothetical protein
MDTARWYVAVSVIVLVASCKSDKVTAPAVAVGSHGSGSAPASTKFPDPCVYVGDVQSQCVDAAQVATWPRLDSLLPPQARRMGMWKSIVIQTLSGRGPDLNQPADTYPDMVPALFPGPNGTTQFGMFDLVELTNHGQPKWMQPAIRELHVMITTGSGRGENEDGHNAVVDPTSLALKFSINGKDTIVAGKEMLAIPRQPQPGEETEAKGWRLLTLLEAAKIPGIQPMTKRLRLTDAAGMNLTLEPSDFDDKTSVPFVKLNKQGSLRFWVFKKKGEGWTKGADLRG